MAVNETLASYDTATPANNTPAGTDSIGTNLDDHLRDMKKNIRFASNTPVQAAKVTAYTTTAGDHAQMILVDASASAVTVTLLAAATAGDGHRLCLKKIDSGTNFVIVDGNSAETIDGAAAITLSAQYQAIEIACDGSNWQIEADKLPSGGIAGSIAGNGLTASASTIEVKVAGAMTISSSAVEVKVGTGLTITSSAISIANGYTMTLVSQGTKSSGTFTPEPANGFMQSATNGGAHVLAPPTTVGMFTLIYTNNASAGAITTSGFGDVFGDAFTTTNGHVFVCLIINDGTNSILKIKALQ